MIISFSTLAILLPGAIMLHVTEEFLFPGGFVKWYNEFVPSKTNKDAGYLVWINTLMIGVCVLPLYLGNTLRGMSIWYCVSAIAAINACFHIWGVLKLKKYSPGVITGTLLYLPLFAIGNQQLVFTGAFPVLKAIVFTMLAIGYHVFSVIRQRK